MREFLSVVLAAIAVMLAFGAYFARNSKKKLSVSVGNLLLSLVFPVAGNLLILISDRSTLSLVGYYVFFLGMNAFMFFMLSFTVQYCNIDWESEKLRNFLYGLLILDSIQLLVNIATGHAFGTELVTVGGRPYYRLVPFFGQALHHIVDYGIFFGLLVVFLIKLKTAPRIYAERYGVILASMVVVGIWQAFFIISRTPMDHSMIGFGLFGLLVFYFSLFYRPTRLMDKMLIRVTSQSGNACFFFDAVGRPVWANSYGLELIGADSEDMDMLDVLLTQKFGNVYLGRANWKEQRVVQQENGTKYYQLENQTMLDAKDGVLGSFLLIRDQTEEQNLLRAEQYNATHDRLTGLYTKDHLYEKIPAEIASTPDKDHLIILLDVDNFKIINDIFGNKFGDLTLIRIAQLIREIAGTRGLYGRISGDAFGLCIPADAFDPDWAEEQIYRFVVDDGKKSHHILIHMGVYATRESETPVSTLFDRARLALEKVKNEYNSLIGYFSNEMRDEAIWNQFISAELSTALENNQIQPYLQPIVDKNGVPVGAEVLVRWIHPKLGILAPARFVPEFERNGMIADVDRLMWRRACDILARWKEEGIDLFLSVNVSPKDFYFMDVAEEIQNVVREYKIEPSKLRIEITETVMMTDMENRIFILNELKEKGFLIEMDDFGSGYSSLNMLKDMPIDLIKMDMVFLRKSADDLKSRIILRSVLQLADELGIPSLSEGVETEKQYQMLTNQGCSLFQGYYFARPMPLADYEAYRKQAQQTEST